MNKLDKQYTDLIQDILENGVTKSDRTGTGTLSVFGRQIRHNMKDGFPLLTTKKMEWHSIATELMWFLRGGTNIKYLVDNNCNIWNGDAYKAYANSDCAIKWLFNMAGKEPCPVDGPFWRHYTREEFVEKIKTDDEFAEQWGELGPIYGAQWRSWNNGIDQITTLINDLKTNPDSRRLMVNAWHVEELKYMVLPPCHYGFQCYTRLLTEKELHQRYPELKEIHRIKNEFIKHESYENAAYYREKEKALLSNLPERAISLMWNQRSVDTGLGLPFNIASYGLLLEIIARIVNMIPDELIGNLGDTHIYSNHVDRIQEQIYRNPFELPHLRINDEFWLTESQECGVGPLHSNFDKLLESIHIDDFQIYNYQSHKSIKLPLSN